ncbi:MAG: hypothetical protein ICV63_05335 [Coleofasciculus sp. Co-bin14]|nr:hypothetical protein [Coleofasciculus sp. Co-bin14]
MIEPRSVSDLLVAPIPDVPQGNRPVRLLACDVLKDVNSVIHQLHMIGFAETIAWTPPIPSPVRGEVIRILTRNVNING